MSELKSFIVQYNGKFIRVYEEKEADKVISELQSKVTLAGLAEACSNLRHKRCCYCYELSRQKYKRCRMIAKYCNAKIEEYRAKYDADEGFGDEWLYWIKFMRKWMRRWLELARQFKGGKQ